MMGNICYNNIKYLIYVISHFAFSKIFIGNQFGCQFSGMGTNSDAAMETPPLNHHHQC
jgi:hypothetical protein